MPEKSEYAHFLQTAIATPPTCDHSGVPKHMWDPALGLPMEPGTRSTYHDLEIVWMFFIALSAEI
jgi:hypothetical protein